MVAHELGFTEKSFTGEGDYQAAFMALLWYEEYGDTWLSIKDALEFAIEAGWTKEGDTVPEKWRKVANKLHSLQMVSLPGGYHFERNSDEIKRTQWRVVKESQAASGLSNAGGQIDEVVENIVCHFLVFVQKVYDTVVCRGRGV